MITHLEPDILKREVEWALEALLQTKLVEGSAKEWSNCITIALILHSSKVMLTIVQTRFQQYVNQEISDVQGGFRKGRGIKDQIANIC